MTETADNGAPHGNETMTGLPGHPLPRPHGAGLLASMDIPDYMALKTELLIDHHGQQYLCFRADTDPEKERWLMVPAHPDKLLRTLTGNSPVLSAIGNADHVLVQDRWPTGKAATHIASQEDVLQSMPHLPSFQDPMELTLDLMFEWAKTIRESNKRLPW